MNRIKMATVSMAAAMMMTVGSVAQPVEAQVIGGGLVNVQVGAINVETGDILSDNVVQVSVQAAANIAANVCGVAVNVLATQIRNGDKIECTADARGAEQNIAHFVRVN